MDIRDIIEQKIKPQIKQPLWESWYIKEKIGSGSFSVVYRIEAQRPGGVDVSALKVEAITTDGQLFTDSGRKTTFLNNRKQMAINEAQIMKKLRDCPNIVRDEEEHIQELYINGTFEGYYYLIRMELLQNVFDLMGNNKFNYSESNVRKLAVEIGQGLRAAHTHGIIHRDIKPDNMFVSKSGIYKLGDFNISKKAVSTRTYAGTQYYMAPEIYRAKANVDSSYTTQADIYSFGLCLYQMMNDGQLPFEDTLDPDTAYDKRMTERVTFPRPHNASPDFARIILKACAFDANARYKSIDDMLAELGGKVSPSSNRTQYADSISSVTRRGNATQYADEDIAPSHRQKNNSKSGKVIAGFLAAIVLIIGGVFFFPKLLKSNDSNVLEDESDSISKGNEEDLTDIITEETTENSEDVNVQTSITTKDTDNMESDEMIKEETTIATTTMTTTTTTSLSETPVKNIEPQDLLSVCPPYKTENCETWSNLSMGGTKYYSGVSIGRTGSWGGEGYALFNLDKKYSLLTFEVGNIDERGVAENQGLFIYLDDRIALSIDLVPGVLPKSYELDVSGAQQMKIYGSTWAGDYGMANIKITESSGSTKDTTPQTNEGKSLLSVIQPYKTDNYEEWVNLSIAGTIHASGICVGRTGSWGGEGYALFNLNASYNSLSFDVGNIDDRGVAKGQIIEIYLDDRLVWSHELNPEEMPTHHEVDLSGAKQMKIYGSTWAGDYSLFDIYIQ